MVTLGDAIDEPTNRLVRAASARLDETAPHGVVDLVPAFASIAVHYDPALVSGSVDEPPYDRLVRELGRVLEDLRDDALPASRTAWTGRTVSLPCR